MTAPTGKRNRAPARAKAQTEGDDRRAQMTRIAEARLARERLVEQQRSEEAAALVGLARAERAKRIAEGKLVAPTLDEFREKITIKGTAMGDLA